MKEKVARFDSISEYDLYTYLIENPDTNDLYIDSITKTWSYFLDYSKLTVSLKHLTVNHYYGTFVYFLMEKSFKTLQSLCLGVDNGMKLSLRLSTAEQFSKLHTLTLNGTTDIYWTPFNWWSFPRLINYNKKSECTLLTLLIGYNRRKTRAVVTTYLSLRHLKICKDVRLMICDYIWAQYMWDEDDKKDGGVRKKRAIQ